jgi:hypothetical protein
VSAPASVQQKKPGALVTMASGAAVAGVELTLGGHAMDRIKTLQQAHLSQGLSPSIREAVKSIYADRGWIGFYKGFRWNILSHSGKSSLRWIAMSELDKLSAKIVPPSFQKSAPYLQTILLAAMTSVCESLCIICPAESFKTKEMLSTHSFRPLSFVQKSGARRIYDGCDAVIYRQFISWASFLIAHQKGTEWMLALTGKKSSKELSIGEKFANGMFAGLVNVAIVAPIDVVKTQMQKLDPVRGKYAIEAIKTIWKEHGLKAFTTGVPIKMVRSSWYSGVTLLVMDKLGIFNPRA